MLVVTVYTNSYDCRRNRLYLDVLLLAVVDVANREKTVGV